MPIIEKMLILGVFGGIALVAGVEFCFLLDFVWHRKQPKRRKSAISSKPAIVVHILAVTGLLCLCYGIFIEAYWVEVNQFTVPTSKLKSVRHICM